MFSFHIFMIRILSSSKWNHVLDPQTERDALETSKERWTKLVSNWNPAMSSRRKGYQKLGRTAKRREDWLTTAQDPSKCD